MRDGSAIAVATNAAAIAVRDGDLAAARATLSAVLGAASASSTAGVPFDADIQLDVAEAAILYARVLAATGCVRDGLAYSASAYQTACPAAPPGSDLRLRAAATHAHLLRTTGDPAAAVPVGRDLARQLVSRFGATDRRTLAAHGDLAVMLHAAGECLTGRQILHRTGELVSSTYGRDDPLGIRMRDRLADLTRQCRPRDTVGTESPDTVADHTCGQPNAASISIADLFGDLFAGAGDEVAARQSDEAVDSTETPPAVTDRPAMPSAGLLATLGVPVPTARPPAPAELRVPSTEVPIPATEVPAPAEVGAEPIETAEIVATAGRGDSRTPDAAGMATTADSDGDPRPAADVGGIEAPECEVLPWADRPTAGFPTVPVAVGLHPTWVAVPPEPASGPRPIGETSTVGVTGTSLADLSVTHSRATFGRMRRFGHPRQRQRPSTTDCNNRS